jgi:hypothetical protein
LDHISAGPRVTAVHAAVILSSTRPHCEPSGLAFGEPKDKFREAVSLQLAHARAAEIASSR